MSPFPGKIVCIRPDGSLRDVADGLSWPNGMALIDDGRRLVVADSDAGQLIAFDVAADGSLAGRRVWADLEDAPAASVPTPTGRVGRERPRPGLRAGAGGR